MAFNMALFRHSWGAAPKKCVGNVWCFLGRVSTFFGRFLAGVWGIFSCGQLQNNSLFKKELTVHVS